MALYDIARSCGHTEQVQIYGTDVHGERRSKAEWMARFPCRACQVAARQADQEARAELALALAAVHDWPELTGSDKQIRWAADIRATWIAETVDRVAGIRPADPERVLDGVMRQMGRRGLTRRIRADADRDPIVGLYAAVALRQTAARWWIDRRDLTKRMRHLSDLLNAGAAHMNHGDLLEAVEAQMTGPDRAALRRLGVWLPDAEPTR